MTFTIHGPLPAGDLFSLEPATPRAGKPDFMNLKAVSTLPRRSQPEHWRGPGIYGVFLDDALFYVGLYTGAGGTPFMGSVLQRWCRHLTYQTLRSPQVSFCRDALARIVALGGEPAMAIAACLGLPDREIAALVPGTDPLLARGSASCTANKARFAIEHWDCFALGRETSMLERVSFVYGACCRTPPCSPCSAHRKATSATNGSRRHGSVCAKPG